MSSWTLQVTPPSEVCTVVPKSVHSGNAYKHFTVYATILSGQVAPASEVRRIVPLWPTAQAVSQSTAETPSRSSSVHPDCTSKTTTPLEACIIVPQSPTAHAFIESAVDTPLRPLLCGVGFCHFQPGTSPDIAGGDDHMGNANVKAHARAIHRRILDVTCNGLPLRVVASTVFTPSSSDSHPYQNYRV